MKRSHLLHPGTIFGTVVLAGALVGSGFAVNSQSQDQVSVTAGQLLTNQKISQAAVRRSNQALNLLAPIRTSATDAADDGRQGVKPGTGLGFPASHIIGGAVTGTAGTGGGTTTTGTPGPTGPAGPKGDPGTPATRLFAEISPGASPTVLYGAGVTGVTNATSFYVVTFDRDISACAPLGTTTGTSGNNVDSRINVVHRFGGPTQLNVRTYTGAAENVNMNIPFSLAVFC